MSTQKRDKLVGLGRQLAEGLLLDSAWMEQHGYSRALRRQYVLSGRLEQPARGVFRRPRGTLTWEQVVISLQALMGYQVSVGGRTALEQQGFTHYVPMRLSNVHLYTNDKLPGWVNKLPNIPSFTIHNRLRLFPKTELDPGGLSEMLQSGVQGDDTVLSGELCFISWGHWRWPLVMSTPERAILELMDELPDRESFEMVDKFMEGLVNLRPRRLQTLLESSQSVKVNRLFLYFASRHGHQWFKHLNIQNINLGSGKREIYKGGVLDKQYQITVPEGRYGQ